MKKILLPILLISILGCSKSEQAIRSTIAIEESAKRYQQNVEKLVESLIADLKFNLQSEADNLYVDAVKSITKSDGTVDANNHQLLMNKKVEHYKNAELIAIETRNKLIAANVDIENLLQYTKTMQEYFKQRTNVAAMLNESSTKMISTLDSLIKKKEK